MSRAQPVQGTSPASDLEEVYEGTLENGNHVIAFELPEQFQQLFAQEEGDRAFAQQQQPHFPAAPLQAHQNAMVAGAFPPPPAFPPLPMQAGQPPFGPGQNFAGAFPPPPGFPGLPPGPLPIQATQPRFGARFRPMEPEQVVGMILGARQEGDAWRQAELLATAIQGLNLKIMEGLRSIPGMGTRVAGPRGTNVEIWEDSCTAIQYKAWLDGNVNGVYLSGHEVISSHVLRWGRFGNFSEHFNEVMSVSYDEAAAIKRGKSCRKVFCNGFAIGGYVTMLLGIIGGIVAGVAMDSDDDMRDFAVGMLLGMVAGLGLMISLMSICINFSCMCLEPENESECLPPRIYYDVQSQIPPIIRSILGRLVGAIPRDMVQQMEAGQRGGGHEEQSVRVAGRFLVECFAKPAHALLAQLLNYLQNPASAASVSIEHFEAIFTLFKLTKQSFVGMNFGADLSFALADAMVNLIVNGSMPLHTMLMNFARLTPTNFNDFPQNDEERYGGFNLYSSERHAVLDKLQGIFMTVQPQIHTMLPEMQAKMNHIKLAIELKMRADQRR